MFSIPWRQSWNPLHARPNKDLTLQRLILSHWQAISLSQFREVEKCCLKLWRACLLSDSFLNVRSRRGIWHWAAMSISCRRIEHDWRRWVVHAHAGLISWVDRLSILHGWWRDAICIQAHIAVVLKLWHDDATWSRLRSLYCRISSPSSTSSASTPSSISATPLRVPFSAPRTSIRPVSEMYFSWDRENEHRGQVSRMNTKVKCLVCTSIYVGF